MIAIGVLARIWNVIDEESLYISIGMREQAPPHHPVLRLRLTRASEADDRQSQHHRVRITSTDRFYTPVVHHRIDRVALAVLMGLDKRVGQQYLNTFLEPNLAFYQILKPDWISRAPTATDQQLKL